MKGSRRNKTLEKKIRNALIKKGILEDGDNLSIIDKLKLNGHIGWVLLMENHEPFWLGHNAGEAINNIETMLGE